MEQALAWFLQFAPETWYGWLGAALAASGTASAVLKFGTPIAKKAAALTKTTKDDTIVAWAEKLGTILGFLAMNPKAQEIVAKRKTTKKTKKKK